MLNVNEIFTTIQGEGPETGKRSTFLRLYGCNLDCSWCDTPYTWDRSMHDPADERHPMTTLAISERLEADLVVVTGGEPLLQASGLVELIEANPEHGFQFETNGTRPPLPFTDDRVSYVVSPKLATAGTTKEGYDYHRLLEFMEVPTAFKFVVTNLARDLAEVHDIQHALGLPNDFVWLMPQGRSGVELGNTAQAVAEAALANGYNFTDRMHVRLWGDERER